MLARQRPFFLVLSLTVVFGRLLTVDCFTKRPEIALRPRLPLLPLVGIVITSLTCSSPVSGQAFWMSFQVTALPAYGGMTLPLAIGAVVEGVPTTSQTPLSGQVCPVRAVVPRAVDILDLFQFNESNSAHS